MAKKSKSSKNTSNRPRFCPDDRLIRRFYEPLVLLSVLDRNSEQRITRFPSEDDITQSARELRRDFLEQLAYVCDHIKGGDTVTAIALEGQPSGVVFWVASNENPSNGMISFLWGILNTLQRVASAQTELRTVEREIAEKCIKFNVKRLKAYQGFMTRHLEQCLDFLRNSGAPEDKALMEWLKLFQGFNDDISSLCNFSYQQRKCQCMRELQRHIGEEHATSDHPESRRENFRLARHFIGRLGSHLRAARILVTAARRLPSLFDNFTIKTLPSPKPPKLPPPVDHLTTLSGIIKRMLPAGSDDTPRVQEALTIMDSKFGIQDRVQAQYEDKDFRPRVHAELHVLEYFYKEGLSFVDDDRFIGCSKPACYCCYLYITYHPGRFVRPACHGIRYLSWRPPDPFNEEIQRGNHHRRDILNKVIEHIRRDTLDHIEKCRGPTPWLPDSTTGITVSQNHDEYHTLERVEDSLQMFDEPKVRLEDISEDDEGSDSDGGVLL